MAIYHFFGQVDFGIWLQIILKKRSFMKKITQRSLFGMFFFCFFTSLLASHPLLEKELYQLRDPASSRKCFRESMKKVGEYLAMDVAGELQLTKVSVTTVLGKAAEHEIVGEDPVLVSILRAGLPLLDG